MVLGHTLSREDLKVSREIVGYFMLLSHMRSASGVK